MNWKAVVVVSALGLGSMQGLTARAQGDPTFDPEILPLVAGQWAGPWDLGASINHVANPEGGTFLQWCEIVHAVLLPDKTNTGKVHVLLICRRDQIADTSHWPPARAFIWDAADPSTLDEVPYPANAANLLNISEDPFCGGHAFTPER